jgi:hypothetical protein
LEISGMKIAIAGPGRSGTSVLVKLLASWGFSVPNEAHNWHETANAGLESRLGSDNPFEVDKDPWAYQYLDKLSDEQLSKYSVLIVPIRDLENAAISRLVNDRAARHDDGTNDYWRWSDWGTVPGGAIYSTSVTEQERLLALGLWRLLDTASSRGMKVLIISFPRFVMDFEYLWGEISPYLEKRIDKSEAKTAFDHLIDPTLTRQSTEKIELSLPEAIGLLELKSKSISSLSKEVESLSRKNFETESLYANKNAELEQKIVELEQKKVELEQKKVELEQKRLELVAISSTLSWRITLPLRKLRNLLLRGEH